MNSVESRTDGVKTVKGVKFSETYSSELRTIDKTDDTQDEVADQKDNSEQEDGVTSCWDMDDGFHRYIPTYLCESIFTMLGGMSAFIVKVACVAVFGSSGLIYWSWLQESDRKKMPESDSSRYLDITLVFTQQLFFIFCPDFLYTWFSRRMDVHIALMFGFIITMIGYLCPAWVDSPLDPITMYCCLTGVGLGLANSAVNLIPTLYFPSTGISKHPISYHKWVRSLFYKFDDFASLALIVGLPSLTFFPLACHANTYDWRTITLPLIILMTGCFVMAVVMIAPLRGLAVRRPVSYKHVEEWCFKGSRANKMAKTQEDNEEEKTKEDNEEKKAKEKNEKTGKNNVKTKEEDKKTQEDYENTQEGYENTKEKHKKTKGDNGETKEDNGETKEDNGETREDNGETKEDNRETKEEFTITIKTKKTKEDFENTKEKNKKTMERQKKNLLSLSRQRRQRKTLRIQKKKNKKTKEDNGETKEEFTITINNQEDDDKTTNKTKPVPENQNNAKAESDLRRSAPIAQMLRPDNGMWQYSLYVMMMGCAAGIIFVYLPGTFLQHGHDFCDICDLYRIFAISFSVSIVVIMILFLIFRPCHHFLMALCAILGIFNVYCFGVRISKEEISSWGNLLYFTAYWGVFLACVMMMENHRHDHLARNDIIPMNNMKNFAVGLSLLVWPPLASMRKDDDLEDSLYLAIMCPLFLCWMTMVVFEAIWEIMWRRGMASLCARHGIHTVDRKVLEITTVGRDNEESNVEAGRKEK